MYGREKNCVTHIVRIHEGMRPLYKFRGMQEDTIRKDITFYNLKKIRTGIFAKEGFMYSFEDAEIFVITFCTTELQRGKRYSTAFRCMERRYVFYICKTITYSITAW
jgi:hypothetical protein